MSSLTQLRNKLIDYLVSVGLILLKIWILSEVDSKYLLNAIPYLGKDDGRTTKGLGEQVTLELIEPYKNKGYHVTSDQFFTSLSLAKKLAERKTSFLGTIRSDRREVPKMPKQPVLSSSFFTSDDETLRQIQDVDRIGV